VLLGSWGSAVMRSGCSRNTGFQKATLCIKVSITITAVLHTYGPPRKTGSADNFHLAVQLLDVAEACPHGHLLNVRKTLKKSRKRLTALGHPSSGVGPKSVFSHRRNFRARVYARCSKMICTRHQIMKAAVHSHHSRLTASRMEEGEAVSGRDNCDDPP
jgi:hypothetical protein